MVTRLRDGVYWLKLTGVNAYLVDESDLPGEDETLTLVDAGTPVDAGRIATALSEVGHRARDLDRILVTHFDVDHVGALGKLPTDAPVYMSARDADLLTGRTGIPLSNHKGLLQRAVRPFVSAPDRIERVGDGDSIGGFDVYATPGHTPGHLSYVHEAASAAFVGDLVIERDGHLRASPWALSYDTEDVRESIHDFADRAPAVEALCPGHGTPYLRGGSVRLAELGEQLEA